VEQVTTAEGEFVFEEPGLALEERFEVIFEQGTNFVVEDDIVPFAANDGASTAANDVEAWRLVRSIKVFKQPDSVVGILSPGDDEVGNSLVIVA
jgi:hypothetical protein